MAYVLLKVCCITLQSAVKEKKFNKLYKGICKATFKKRFANHKKSFNAKTYKIDTKFSTEYRAINKNQLSPIKGTLTQI